MHSIKGFTFLSINSTTMSMSAVLRGLPQTETAKPPVMA